MSVTEAILLTPELDAPPIALMPRQDVKRRPRYWNVWWTLSVVFMALSILVAVLGVGLSMMSGLTGALRSSGDQIGEAIVTLEVSGSRVDIRTLGTGLE